MAREAMRKEMVNSKSRRISERNQTFESMDIASGGSVIFHKQISRKSPPKWRGPAIIWEIGDSGVLRSGKFQSQTF